MYDYHQHHRRAFALNSKTLHNPPLLDTWMFNTLKEFFDTITSQPDTATDTKSEHALQLATAVLLAEVMRSDYEIEARERHAILTALSEQFTLTEDEVIRLLELAEQTAQDAYDYQHFTALLNQHFSIEQKVLVIEYMWRVAYADDHLSAHENHLMRKISALLYIPHADYIGAKMRARITQSGDD